jgi:cation transport regulator ChaC
LSTVPPGSLSPPRWVFAYGSLMWRPGFAHAECLRGYVLGWARRFWQGSPDHRGRPEDPGRVVTLVPDRGARCHGLAYRLPDAATTLLGDLDLREQGGYERRRLTFWPDDAGRESLDVLTYVAPPDNAYYLGPASPDELAQQVRRCHGPSGSNVDYVIGLSEALEALGVDDPHVSGLAQLLR